MPRRLKIVGGGARWLAAGLMLLGVGPLACDGPPPAARRAPDEAPRDEAVLLTLARLEPNRQTHLAVTRDATWFVQFEPRGTDAVFRLPAFGVPEASQLSTLRLGEAVGRLFPGAPLAELRGNFTSLAAAPDGDVFFYFRGSAGLQSVCVLGRYDVQTQQIIPIAGTERLTQVSGLRNLELAAGSLIPTYKAAGSDVWLWLRSPTEPGRLLKFDVAAATQAARIDMPFGQVLADGIPVSLNGLDDAMGYDAEARLILVSRTDGLLYRIDPSGSGALLLSLRDLPAGVTAPVPLAQEELVFFAPEAQPQATAAAPIAPNLLDVDLPAFVRLVDRDVSLLPEPQISSPPGFPTYALSLAQLVRSPEPYTYIAYDMASGSLLSVRLPLRW